MAGPSSVPPVAAPQPPAGIPPQPHAAQAAPQYALQYAGVPAQEYGGQPEGAVHASATAGAASGVAVAPPHPAHPPLSQLHATYAQHAALQEHQQLQQQQQQQQHHHVALQHHFFHHYLQQQQSSLHAHPPPARLYPQPGQQHLPAPRLPHPPLYPPPYVYAAPGQPGSHPHGQPQLQPYSHAAPLAAYGGAAPHAPRAAGAFPGGYSLAAVEEAAAKSLSGAAAPQAGLRRVSGLGWAGLGWAGAPARAGRLGTAAALPRGSSCTARQGKPCR